MKCMSCKCHIVFLQSFYHFLLGFLFYFLTLLFAFCLCCSLKKVSVVLSPLILYFITCISILPLLRRLANLFSREKEEEGLSRWPYKHVTPASGSLSWGSLRVDEVVPCLENGHIAFHLFSIFFLNYHMPSVLMIFLKMSQIQIVSYLWLGKQQQKPNSPTRFCEKFTLTKNSKVLLQLVFLPGVGSSVIEFGEQSLSAGPVRWPWTGPSDRGSCKAGVSNLQTFASMFPVLPAVPVTLLLSGVMSVLQGGCSDSQGRSAPCSPFCPALHTLE